MIITVIFLTHLSSRQRSMQCGTGTPDRSIARITLKEVLNEFHINFDKRSSGTKNRESDEKINCSVSTKLYSIRSISAI